MVLLQYSWSLRVVPDCLSGDILGVDCQKKTSRRHVNTISTYIHRTQPHSYVIHFYLILCKGVTNYFIATFQLLVAKERTSILLLLYSRSLLGASGGRAGKALRLVYQTKWPKRQVSVLVTSSYQGRVILSYEYAIRITKHTIPVRKSADFKHLVKLMQHLQHQFSEIEWRN